MIHGRHIELHAVKLQDFRYNFPRLLKLGIGMHQVEFRVIGAAVIRRYHPAQTILLRLLCIDRSWVGSVGAFDGLRRIPGSIVSGTPMAVDVRVSGQPGARLIVLWKSK